MDLLDYFRRGLDAGWVCKRAARLTLDNGKTVRLRPGQVIYTGDFRYQGSDLALTLDQLIGDNPAWTMERPQNLREAVAAR
ncbi:MAG TPA: hypothetical protein VEQ16_04495 [Acidocella sp.]|jgi:hypothetical protein|nr:hypothetical protein [Acidocella sp.]